MGDWWQRGRRSRRSPSRLLGQFLETRYGAAEGVLGAVALVLVVWLLWPEDRGPKLDQRASWQQSVEEAERRRAALQTERAAKGAADGAGASGEVTAEVERRVDVVERPAEPARRRIAKPSELADRLDTRGLRTFEPGPKRPAGPNELAIDSEPSPIEVAHASESLAPEATSPEATSPEASSDNAQVVLNEVIEGLEADPPALADPGVLPLVSDQGDSGEPQLENAALSSEAPHTEPLPAVDLSDLDTLAPLRSVEPQPVEQPAVAALDPALPDDPTVPGAPAVVIDPAIPDTATLVPSQDAAIEPFRVEQDDAEPASDVGERPRDDAPTWLKNAVTAAVDDARPIIAVVIDDLGLNRSNTAALNDLSAPLTLAFLPYAGRIEAQTEAAQEAGHELMLHLPMEPVGSDWPGPDALTTKIDRDEFTTRLQKNLSRFKGFVGINNHMGSKLTADSKRMNVVMRELRNRDVLFLDSKTSSRSVAGKLAGEHGVPNTTRDIFLDHVIDYASIKRQLVRTEIIARRTGSAVAIGHPHGATIRALREWLPSLEARGFVLAPISAVVARRACSNGVLIAAETCGRYLQARTPPLSTLAAKGG